MTDTPQAPRCEPPAGTVDGTWHFLRSEGVFRRDGPSIDCWRWYDDLWRHDSNGASPEQMALYGWRYLDAVPIETAEEVAALRAERDAAVESYRAAWDGLNFLREVVETLGPVGAVPNAEHLGDPTPLAEAAAIAVGIRKIATERDSLCAALEQAVEMESNIHLDLLANGDTCPCGNGRVPTGAYRAATAAYAKAIRTIIPVASSAKERAVSEELKPCPLCGSTQHVALETSPMAAVSADRRAHVHCWKCGASGPVFEDMRVVAEAKAIAAWNRRAAEPQEASDNDLRSLAWGSGSKLMNAPHADVIRAELRRLGLRVVKA